MAIAHTKVAMTAITMATPADATWSLTGDLGYGAGVLVEVLACNPDTGADYILGVRGGDSSLDRKYSIRRTIGGGNNAELMVAMTNSAGKLQLYSQDESATAFYVCGYLTGISNWTELAFLNIGTTFDSGNDNAWLEVNMTSNYSIPANSICWINHTNDSGAPRVMGSRTAGGSDFERKWDISTSSVDQTGIEFLTKVNGSGLADLFRENWDDGELLCQGYWPSTDCDFQETYDFYVHDPGTDSTWTDTDINASIDEDGRIVDFLLLHQDADQQELGVREYDSTVQSKLNTGKPSNTSVWTGWGCLCTSYQSEGAGSGFVEVYGGDISEAVYWALGYLIPPVPSGQPIQKRHGGVKFVGLNQGVY